MNEEHALLKQNLAAYALNALDADEVEALEAHLRLCAECQAELRAFQQIGEGLLLAVPPHAPPPAIKRRLLRRIAGRRAAPRPAFRTFLQMASAIALVLLFLLNLFTALQVREFQRQQQALLRQLEMQRTAAMLLSYPGTSTVLLEAEGISGSLLFNRDRSVALLFLWGLGPLDSQHTYQVWLVDQEGQRVNGGTFQVMGEEPYTLVMVNAAQPFGTFRGLSISVEPLGGSPQPTGPRLFQIEF